MTDKAAIQAQFVDFKNVKTRSVMQIIMEVDISEAQHVLSTLGYPDNSKDIPVAVARLAAKQIEHKPEVKDTSRIKAFKALVNDKEFKEFVLEEFDLEDAEFLMKTSCNIESSKQLEDNDYAWKIFKQERQNFYDWKRVREQEKHYVR